MKTVAFTLMIAAMAAVFGSLLIGLYAMAKPGKEARKLSNKMMKYRVYLQGFALALFVLAVILSAQE